MVAFLALSAIVQAINPSMSKFEKAYQTWLTNHAHRKEDSGAALRDLITELSALRSQYPPARLATCGEGTKPEDLLILDRTQLGSGAE